MADRYLSDVARALGDYVVENQGDEDVAELCKAVGVAAQASNTGVLGATHVERMQCAVASIVRPIRSAFENRDASESFASIEKTLDAMDAAISAPAARALLPAFLLSTVQAHKIENNSSRLLARVELACAIDACTGTGRLHEQLEEIQNDGKQIATIKRAARVALDDMQRFGQIPVLSDAPSYADTGAAAWGVRTLLRALAGYGAVLFEKPAVVKALEVYQSITHPTPPKTTTRVVPMTPAPTSDDTPPPSFVPLPKSHQELLEEHNAEYSSVNATLHEETHDREVLQNVVELCNVFATRNKLDTKNLKDSLFISSDVRPACSADLRALIDSRIAILDQADETQAVQNAYAAFGASNAAPLPRSVPLVNGAAVFATSADMRSQAAFFAAAGVSAVVLALRLRPHSPSALRSAESLVTPLVKIPVMALVVCTLALSAYTQPDGAMYDGMRELFMHMSYIMKVISSVGAVSQGLFNANFMAVPMYFYQTRPTYQAPSVRVPHALGWTISPTSLLPKVSGDNITSSLFVEDEIEHLGDTTRKNDLAIFFDVAAARYTGSNSAYASAMQSFDENTGERTDEAAKLREKVVAVLKNPRDAQLFTPPAGVPIDPVYYKLRGIFSARIFNEPHVAQIRDCFSNVKTTREGAHALMCGHALAHARVPLDRAYMAVVNRADKFESLFEELFDYILDLPEDSENRVRFADPDKTAGAAFDMFHFLKKDELIIFPGTVGLWYDYKKLRFGRRKTFECFFFDKNVRICPDSSSDVLVSKPNQKTNLGSMDAIYGENYQTLSFAALCRRLATKEELRHDIDMTWRPYESLFFASRYIDMSEKLLYSLYQDEDKTDYFNNRIEEAQRDIVRWLNCTSTPTADADFGLYDDYDTIRSGNNAIKLQYAKAAEGIEKWIIDDDSSGKVYEPGEELLKRYCTNLLRAVVWMSWGAVSGRLDDWQGRALV
jgi:hypothetical protein